MPIETGWTYQGYAAVLLENEWLRLTVLTDKGCDIARCIYKQRDLPLTWSTDWGLRPKGLTTGFLENYEGGWQFVFPNGGPPCDWHGVHFEQHGDVNLLPWQVLSHGESAKGVELVCAVDSVAMPFHLRRTVLLLPDHPALQVSTTITSMSPQPLPIMFGEHLVFGPPFLAPNEGRIDMPVGVTAHAGIVANTDTQWPQSPLSGPADLRELPPWGAEGGVVYLTHFGEGWYRLRGANPMVEIEVQWDALQLPYVWMWREFGQGGAPWFGRHYNLGLEPFTSYPSEGLTQAVRNGSALWMAPYATRNFTVNLSVRDYVNAQS